MSHRAQRREVLGLDSRFCMSENLVSVIIIGYQDKRRFHFDVLWGTLLKAPCSPNQRRFVSGRSLALRRTKASEEQSRFWVVPPVLVGWFY